MKFTRPIRLAVRRGMTLATLLAMPCCGQPLAAGADGKALPQRRRLQRQSNVANRPATTQLNVNYVAGKLTVTATNVSLNQILREVSSKIGMKVTGGVADERVYGQYGPSAPAVVLASLLDGTGSNMLLVEQRQRPDRVDPYPSPGRPNSPQPERSAAGTPGTASRRNQPQPAQPATQPTIPPVIPRRGSGTHPPRAPRRSRMRRTPRTSPTESRPRTGPEHRSRSITSCARCSNSRPPQRRSSAELALRERRRRRRAAA